MYFEINPASGVPIYLQIVQQIRYAVSSGMLKPGAQLPSVRELSVKLRVNPNTIAKAYGELEHAGLIETRRGMGTFVAAEPPEIDGKRARKIVATEMNQVVVTAVQLGMGDEEIRDVLEEKLDKLESKISGRKQDGR